MVVVAMIKSEVKAMEETGVVATMEKTKVAVEAKWEEETTTEMICATNNADDCLEHSCVSDIIHSETARVSPTAFLMASCWVMKLSGIWTFKWYMKLSGTFGWRTRTVS